MRGSIVCVQNQTMSMIFRTLLLTMNMSSLHVNLLARVVVACLCSDERSAVWLKSFDGHG